MPSRGVTSSPFFADKKKAGHGKFGKRTQRPNIYFRLSSVDLMYWMNPSEVTRTLQIAFVLQEHTNDEG